MVAEGTPEAIVRAKGSDTGPYLAPLLAAPAASGAQLARHRSRPRVGRRTSSALAQALYHSVEEVLRVRLVA